MAFISASFSNRKIQSRRFTGLTFDSQEAFTSVLDVQGGDVLTDDRYIPTSSLLFSGSSQHNLIVSRSNTDTSIIEGSSDDGNVLKYFFRHKLTRAANAGIANETFYFLKDEPSAASDAVSSDGLVSGSQLTDFINNKNALGSLGAGDAENIGGNGLAYNVVVFKSTDADKANIDGDDKIDAGEYVFDYKTGILTFLNEDAIGANEYIYMTAYRYVGRTLKSQIEDGSLGGGGASSFNDLTDVPSGLLSGSSFSSTAQGTLSASINGVATIVDLGLKTTGDVTFNTVNASTINADIIEASEYIVSSSITYMTQSFSGGSTIFGDSIDDTHLFTGSLKLTGSLTADIPTTTTSERTPLVIDDNGNITISDEDYITDGDIGVLCIRHY